jgi:hypothetical protein
MDKIWAMDAANHGDSALINEKYFGAMSVGSLVTFIVSLVDADSQALQSIGSILPGMY